MLPIVYSPGYNISMLKMEKLHPFDSAKYGRAFNQLVEKGITGKKEFHVPDQASQETLLRVHSEPYLDSLKKASNIARIMELPQLSWVPAPILRNKVLEPLKLATGGTIKGAGLAMEKGWAINLGGGFHHAKEHNGEGFCYFADINLAAKSLWDTHPDMKIMVVDLDAHQGNGFASIFKNDPRVSIFDVYNKDIYPRDREAAQYISHPHPIPSWTGDESYLFLLMKKLPKAMDEVKPDFVIYNAGTDIYQSDPLGSLSITANGILVRDEVVLEQCLERKIPILMVLSGGYTRDSASLIASSISYSFKKLNMKSRLQA